MNSRINLKITSPERVVFDETIDQISLPTPLGEITILPHHVPLVSTLVPGEIIIKKDAEEISLAVSGGFIEINPGNVIILADTAERSDEIDEARAQEARSRAEQLLKEKRVDAIEYTALAAQLEKELARLRVVRKRRRINH